MEMMEIIVQVKMVMVVLDDDNGGPEDKDGDDRSEGGDGLGGNGGLGDHDDDDGP